MNTVPTIDRIRTETFVSEVLHEPEMESTNDLANTLAATDDCPTGLLIWTDQQTKGRGRGKNSWQGGTGALTFSVLIDPTSYRSDLAPQFLPQISLWTGLGIRAALEPFSRSSPVTVKWPNDIYIGGRKAAGILIEQSAQPDRLIVGVGINVNNRFLIESNSTDASLGKTAVSLGDLAGGHPVDIGEVLVAVLQQLDSAWREFGDGTRTLVDRWQPHCYLTGKQMAIQSGPKSHAGVCLGITADGALQLQPATGQPTTHYGGIVTHME